VSLLLSIDVFQGRGVLMCFKFRRQCAGVFGSASEIHFENGVLRLLLMLSVAALKPLVCW